LIGNFGLRIYGNSNSPIDINWDEAALGYNAYSLMMTGKDEYGTKLPLNLRSFDDYKPALYAYLTIPFIKMFGLSPETLRLTSAFWGTLSLIPLLLIIQSFLGNWKKSILWWAMMAMGPMRFHYSRVALESNLSMSFFSWGGYGILEYLKNKKIKFGVLGVLGFVASIYSYHSARLAAPALLMMIALDPLKWFFDKKLSINKEWKMLTVGCLILIGLMIPLFVNNGASTVTRFSQENIWTKFYPFTPRGLYEGKLSEVLLSNPIYYLGGIIAGHTFAYLSPFNLINNQYHWIRRSVMYIPGFNVLGMIEGLLVVVGMAVIIKKSKEIKYRRIIYWFVAGIAPAVVTWNWFHTLRMSNSLPIIELAVVIGIEALLSRLNKKFYLIGKLGLILLMMVTSIYVFNNEVGYSVYETHGEFQPGGYREGVPIVDSIVDDYDKVIVDTSHANPYIFFLFYSKYNPVEFQNKNNVSEVVGTDDSMGYNFGKYEFRKIDWGKDQKLKKTILWMKPDIERQQVEAVEGAKMIKSIRGPIKDYVSAVIVTLD